MRGVLKKLLSLLQETEHCENSLSAVFEKKTVITNSGVGFHPLIIKTMKLKIYPAMLVAAFLVLLGASLGRFQITIRGISSQPEVPPKAATLMPVTPPLPQATPTPSVVIAPTASPPSRSRQSQPPRGPQSPPKNPGLGTLRVSNRTDHPVRVALLAQKAQKSYKEPAHWDFAPGEGSGKGLVLSLPEGSLKVKPGDILVVFAQDGSRLYWGPYVAGETVFPAWNNQVKEWLLILQP